MRAEEEDRRREEILKKQEQQKLYELERKCLEVTLHETHIAKLAEAAAAKKLEQENNAAEITSKKSVNGLIAGRCQLFEQKLAEIASTISKPLTKPKNFKYQVGISKNNAPIVNASINVESNNNSETIDEKSLSVESVLQQFKQNQLNLSLQSNSQQIPVLPVSPVLRIDNNQFQLLDNTVKFCKIFKLYTKY